MKNRPLIIYVLCLLLIAAYVLVFLFDDWPISAKHIFGLLFSGKWQSLGKIGWIGLVVLLALVGLCVAGITRILEKRKWGYYFAMITPWAIFSAQLKQSVYFGIYGEAFRYWCVLGVVAAILIIIFQKKTGEYFNLNDKDRKALRVVAVIFVAVLALQVIAYFQFIYPKTKKWITGEIILKKETYPVGNGEFLLARGVVKRSLFDYEMYLPVDFSIRSVGDTSLILANTDKEAWLTVENFSWFGRRVQEASFSEAFGFATPYDFEKKLYNERFGIVPLMLKDIEIGSGKCDFYEVTFPGCRGFFQIIDKGRQSVLYHYSLYFGNDKKRSLSLTFGVAKNSHFDPGLIKLVVSSIKRNTVAVTASAFFERGVAAMSAGDYESAKFEFAEAINRDSHNPSYYYQLGLAYVKTARWCAAKGSLTEALKLKPDYPDAKNLLQTVEENTKGMKDECR